MRTALLEVDHIARSYPVANGGDPFCVFENLSLKVMKGEFVTVIGHSGCGKSTLLNIIAGIDRADKGCVLLNGKVVAEPGLDRMVVFQNFALMPWMTVYQNVLLAVQAAFPGWSEQEKNGHTRRYLEMVSLKGAEDKYPSALSGGMRQRCGLARAFAAQPPVMLLDEPFAQIDALTRGVIQDELIRMWNETNVTIFMVTHDVDEAILLSDRILLMSAGPYASIARKVDIPIPRPRTRQSIIEDPLYYELRNGIIKFLGDNHVPETRTA
ncbi:MAG: ABC transporter ATP-binding protein [Desulfovibrio sp.]|jgi:nitrate/nitrite transport system ATP-binding protein|nr:ABC transporter ATP-binding protein [Desulfovibrio sp.]